MLPVVLDLLQIAIGAFASYVGYKQLQNSQSKDSDESKPDEQKEDSDSPEKGDG